MSRHNHATYPFHDSMRAPSGGSQSQKKRIRQTIVTFPVVRATSTWHSLTDATSVTKSLLNLRKERSACVRQSRGKGAYNTLTILLTPFQCNIISILFNIISDISVTERVLFCCCQLTETKQRNIQQKSTYIICFSRCTFMEQIMDDLLMKHIFHFRS